MEKITTPTSRSKCFSFWPLNRRQKAAASVRISWPDVEIEEAKSQLQVVPKPLSPLPTEKAFSKATMNTFSVCSAASKEFTQRLTLQPFFGLYAGSEVTFEVKRKSRDHMLNIRVYIRPDGCDSRMPLTTLYRRSGQTGLSIRDRCISFANDVNTPSNIAEIASSCKQPSSLRFLCEKHVLLNLGEVNSDYLPKTPQFDALRKQSTRNVFVRVYQQEGDLMLRMRVKSRLSLSELKWMICGRLPFPLEPSKLSLYESGCLDVLPNNEVIQAHQSLFHCTIETPATLNRPHITTNCRYMVSLIGNDVAGITAHPAMSLFKFNDLVKAHFNLKQDSYIYFASIGKNLKGDSNIKMSTIVDKSTISLIDSMRRNLPIVDGMPLAVSRYEKLPAYLRPISSYGFTPATPIIAFEVTGPTIPISFRAAVQDRGNSNYSVVSDNIHAVSVNPDWKIQTLLKYVESISKIPCTGISLDSNQLSLECNVSSYLTRRCWLSRAKNQELVLVKDLPIIIHS